MKPRRMIGLLLALLVVAAMLPRTAAAAEEPPVSEPGSTATAQSAGPSYYTVEFTYGDLRYVLQGGESVPLADVLAAVGLEGEPTAAESSAPELFSVEMRDGARIVSARRAFSSAETLTVTIDGGGHAIAVTDAQGGECGDGVSWVLSEATRTLTIYKTSGGTGEMRDYISVSSAPWYDDPRYIERVVIEDGVTSIGDRAFLDCESLKNVEISGSVRTIGDSAFENCASLASVTFGDGSQLATIGENAFYGCYNLEDITIPGSVTSIGKFAFFDCESLKNVEIPGGVKTIGVATFRYCRALASVTIPKSVTYIANHAFDSCDSLEDIFVDNLEKDVGAGESWSGGATVHWRHEVATKASPEAGGTVEVTPAPSSGLYWDKDPDTIDPTVITVTAEPKSGYALAKLTYAYGGTETDITGTGSFDMPNADVTVTATFKPKLTITAYDQTYEYNGQTQGEGDTLYEDAAEIASKVKVEGLRDGDVLTSITIDGQGEDVGEYPLVPSNAAIDGNTDYVIEYVNGTLKIVNKYTVSVTASPKAGGTVTGEGRYFNDAEVILTATPSTGYRFVRWESGDEQGVDGATETEVSFAMPEKNVAVTAVFELETYEVTFVDWDGTVLKAATEYPYGTPAADVAKPANPTRPATEQYEYTFAGWDPEVAAVTANATYTASYTEAAREYTITFVNWDGTVLQSGKVAYGTVPAYTGEEPSRAATEQYEYAFSGWLPELVAVTGDATYTATYGVTPRSYTVTFVDWDGTVLQSGKVAYGAMPAYTGATPTRAADAQYSYAFSGWLPELAAVTGDATYTATYTATPLPTPERATLTFDLAGGTMDGRTGMVTVEANVGDTITIPGPPTREGYAFKYWRGSHYNPGDSYAVVGDHFFSAVWEAVPVPKSFTVTFDANGHGTAPAAQTVAEGKTATKPTDPTAEGWTFGGWHLDRSCTKAYDFSKPVTADITLYAKWTKQEGKTLPATGDPAAAVATLLALGPGLALAGLALRRRTR